MQNPLNMVTAVVRFQKSETLYGIGHIIPVYWCPDNSRFMVSLRLNLRSKSGGISSENWVLR